VLPATTSQAVPSLELRARKKERTREAIEDAALDLFIEHGFEDATVEQIAARADVSKATFFRYFASKADVIFGRPDERHRQLHLGIVERPASEDDLTAVRVAVKERWLPTVDPQRTIRQTLAARTSPVLRGLSLDVGSRWQEDVSRALAERRRLAQPDRRCRLAAAAAFTVLSNAVNLWMDGEAGNDLADVVDEGFVLLCAVCCDAKGEQRGGSA
jgi:AcrR family transcriptional regulator